MIHRIILTAIDFEKNGFVKLAYWNFDHRHQAHDMIDAVGRLITPAECPDARDETMPFAYILDQHEDISGFGDNMVGNSPLFGLQTAMRLAPREVGTWLNDRPEPDDVLGQVPPRLPHLQLNGMVMT